MNKLSGFSVIDNDMVVEGSLSCDGQLVIRGSVKGSIKAQSVVISDDGAVTSDIKVKSMVNYLTQNLNFYQLGRLESLVSHIIERKVSKN
ncbi:MAG: polymer-forming cytoskeletal protein, partial [Desulfobacterales bacterium]|nr:polymer-forming cytoskeletal protein [Desulfobacterales bacterium]